MANYTKLLQSLSAVAALFVLASCESAPYGSDDAKGTGMGYGQDGYEVDGYAPDGSVTPGTQADLITNVGDRVFFDFDSSVLDAEAQRTLEKQAQWIKQHPNVRVTIEGHADERGTREYNLALGERRANAAKRYLINMGVSPDRITTVSYGKERPAVLGHNEAAWAQNRRAVTLVTR